MEEHIVSSRVVGSANPIARKFRKFTSALGGVGCGFVAVIVSFVLIYQSINGVVENSKTVGALELKKPADVVNEQGMVKVADKPENTTPAVFKYTACESRTCTSATDNEVKMLENLLQYDVKFQRYEVVKKVTTETRTRVENGQEIEDKVEKIEYKEEWVDKYDDSGWGTFSLGEIKVIPSDKTMWVTTTESKEIPNVVLTQNVDGLNNYGQTVTNMVGSTRAVVTFVKFSDSNLIVVGDIAGKQIQGGTPFIVSNKSDADLLEYLQTSENTQRIVYMVIAWIAMFAGLTMIMAPLMELIDFIPFVGTAAKAVAGVVAIIMATVIVAFSWILMKFWWVILLCVIGMIALAVFLIMKKKNAPETKPAAENMAK